MGLQIKTLAANLAGIGFNIASDLAIPCVFVHVASTAYDTSSGVAVPSNVSKNVNAMILQFSQKETDGTVVKVGDEKVLIRCSELSGVTPGTDDSITQSSPSITRQIIGFEKDAVSAIYRFHCRREVAA